ncbi:hypothetical protein QA601_00320 [Chitinispirillales bacterium ANBcel5]|uniref:hypothetical protein n=1 Tax=Cellulosispirillum alkaliphilum TaxID=3039283 RepID=UPI002A4FB555|nr:hypothetical protein [Chitinispirillales bacterium ANBcel5]
MQDFIETRLKRPGYKPVLSEAEVWTALIGQRAHSSDIIFGIVASAGYYGQWP